MKLVKWLLVLFVILGAVYFATSVKLGGRTLFQRVMGKDSKASMPGKQASVDDSSSSAAKKSATDLHTIEEQEGLEKLIKNKLDKGSAHKGAPVGTGTQEP